MIGTLTSNKGWSSIKFTGSPIASRFINTSSDQELVKFLDKTGEKIIPCNSITIEADSADLYFSVWRFSKGEDPDNFDFTDEPVFYVPAGESVNISGLGIGAIKFANASGTGYFIQGLSY